MIKLKALPKNSPLDSTLYWDIFDTSIGVAVMGIIDKSICALWFEDKYSKTKIEKTLGKFWPGILLERNSKKLRPFISKTELHLEGRGSGELTLVVRGTPFQAKVWNALMKVPSGSVVHYKDIAEKIKSPRAVRAVGTAVGANLISYLIPCHRVVPASGGVGNYRWGSERKEKLLKMEKTQVAVS